MLDYCFSVLVVGHTVCGGCKAAYAAAPEDADNVRHPSVYPLMFALHFFFAIYPASGKADIDLHCCSPCVYAHPCVAIS